VIDAAPPVAFAKDFLSILDLAPVDLDRLLASAAQMKADRRVGRQAAPALAGLHVALLFEKPSLRTRSTFEIAIRELGGDTLHLPAQFAEGVREPLVDIARNLERWVRALVIRTFAQQKAAIIADAGRQLHVINALTDEEHPCQALADWHTMDELRVPERGKFVLSWANHPRALPLAVPSSTVHMAAQRGMEVVVLRPDGFALPESIMEKARQAAKSSGGSVRETTDRSEALDGAHVLYAKEWGSPQHYGDSEAETRLREYLSDWCVKDSWFKTADPKCHFMHCLPVRRNVAVADEVLDGPRSVVIREAFNRMVVQMAVLYRMLK
jgi:ornithine carbamoyltransferase